MKSSSSSNSVLDEARKRAESRASILNSLSASFKEKSNDKSKRPRDVLPSSSETKAPDSKKRKMPEASSSSQSSSANKALQASVVQAKDTNNKSIELVMSFVESMSTSMDKESAQVAAGGSNESSNPNSSSDPVTSSRRQGFTSIRFRNRLHEYLQEQLPSKALLLDNGSAQLDAIQRSRGQSARNQPTFANVSNRELMEIHGSSTAKRRKVWAANIQTGKMTLSTLQQMHDQWLTYTYRAFLSKGIDEQALQTRLFNGLELVGAYVQLFRNTTYNSSRYRSSALAPRAKNDHWEDGWFGYVVDVSPSCYYIVRSVDENSGASPTPDSSRNKQALPLEVLCVHKVACNLAVFLPTAATEKEARARINELAKTALSGEDESDDAASIISENEGDERGSDGVGSTLPLAIADGVDADVSMNMDEGITTDRQPSFHGNHPVFIIFGMYFDRHQRTRQKEFPYSIPPSSSAL